MQTICAHCYALLSHRRQRTACILCARCEQNWEAGKSPLLGHRTPEDKDSVPPFVKAQLAVA